MTNAPISDVTNLTISNLSNLSEPVEGVCSGTMDKHGFVRVGEEKYFLGLDVLQACGFASIQYKDGAAIRFAWVPARPSNKIAVVIAIDGRTGKADDTALLKALEAKPAPKPKSKSKAKPAKRRGKGGQSAPAPLAGKQVLRDTVIKPEFIFPQEGDTFGAVMAKDMWKQGHIFVRGTMVFVPEEEGYFPLQEHEAIRFGTPDEEPRERLFVHISQIPNDLEDVTEIMNGETFAVQVIRDKHGRLAGKIIGLLGAPAEESDQAETSEPEKAPDDNIVDLTKRTAN